MQQILSELPSMRAALPDYAEELAENAAKVIKKKKKVAGAMFASITASGQDLADMSRVLAELGVLFPINAEIAPLQDVAAERMKKHQTKAHLDKLHSAAQQVVDSLDKMAMDQGSSEEWAQVLDDFLAAKGELQLKEKLPGDAERDVITAVTGMATLLAEELMQEKVAKPELLQKQVKCMLSVAELLPEGLKAQAPMMKNMLDVVTRLQAMPTFPRLDEDVHIFCKAHREEMLAVERLCLTFDRDHAKIQETPVGSKGVSEAMRHIQTSAVEPFRKLLLQGCDVACTKFREYMGVCEANAGGATLGKKWYETTHVEPKSFDDLLNLARQKGGLLDQDMKALLLMEKLMKEASRGHLTR